MTYVPLADSIGTGVRIGNAEVSSGVGILIRQGIEIISTDNAAVSLPHIVTSLTIDGYLYGRDYGVTLDAILPTAFNYRIMIGEMGVVSSEFSWAFYLGSNSDSDFTGNRINLNNAGSVTSLNSGGAFLFHAEFASLVNSGSIRTTSTGDFYDGAVQFYENTNSYLMNTGLLETTSPGAAPTGATVFADGGSQNLSLVNYGQILSPSLAVYSAVTGTEQVRNFGTIGGDVILSDATASTLLNVGRINGDVSTQAGNDTVVNRGGQIFGTVELGAGNDTFDNRGGSVNGLVSGGDGDDRFIMNALEAEEIVGGLNFDSVDFQGGPGVILALDGSFDSAGAAAQDNISQVERVFGSRTANDRIRGDGLTNQLFGNGGNDRLDGAGGADLIQGGSGTDTLIGGLGSDTFRFIALAEAGDAITDFGAVAGNDDRFQILASAFGGGLVAGVLAAANFQTRADNLAQDGTDRFVFRTTDHTLWFDADGTGAGAAVMLADLQTGAVVTAADIFLI